MHISNVYANSSIHIALSNYITNNELLAVIANNTANSQTIGYQADNPLITNIDVLNGRKKNSYPILKSTYISKTQGALKRTGRNLDIAINGKGYYFKYITPKGMRYSLNGHLIINSEGILVSTAGYPIASQNSDIIPVPHGQVAINTQGTVFVDGLQINKIGVFTFDEKYNLSKEGNGLYKSSTNDTYVEDPNIMTESLAMSNADTVSSMTNLVEVQRAVTSANHMMNELHDLQKNSVAKLLK